PSVDSTGAPWSLLDLRADNGDPAEEMLHTLDTSQAPWIEDPTNSTGYPKSIRDITCGDVDGDGLEEIVTVYMNGGEVRVFVVDDEAQGFAQTDFQPLFIPGVTNVTIEAGDFDGDGDDDLALGLSIDDSDGRVSFLRRNAAGTWDSFGRVLELLPVGVGVTSVLDLSAGNADADGGEELLVSMNEMSGSNYTPDGVTRWTLLDDADSGFATLRAFDLMQGLDQNNTLRTSEFCSVLLGDVDGDDLAEVVLTGMTEYERRCNGWGNFFQAFDLENGSLDAIGGHYDFFFWDNCNSPADPRMHYLFSGMADFDDDGRPELFVNQTVYRSFADAAPWTEATELSLSEDAYWSQNEHGHRNLNTMDVAVGDFDGDARDDIAIYRQDEDRIEVWGIGELQSSTTLNRTVDTSFHNSQDPIQPRLVAANVDMDSAVLKYDDAEHQLVFTSPIVIAALAAAPYRSGIDQNLDGCYTAFGNTTSGSQSSEFSVTFTASASVGLSADGGALTQSSAELKETLTVEARAFVNHTYTLSETILYTTGPAEDTVIFTSVPIDLYKYRILSHPDPDLIGDEVVVRMPRTPVTLQAERGFYNRTIEGVGPRIDASVFQHAIGNPDSYPTRSQRNALLAGGGLQTSLASVGQGAGSTELTLDVGTEIGVGGSLEIGYERSVEATAATVLVGASIGASVGAEFQVTSGSSTTYTGSVGSIGAADFAANAYQFGLFTYVHRDPGTGVEYEVLNYWVE
ncbi:MAG: VCBS repeat-containing protein, partial [Planctomycetota bacterium]